MTLATWPLEQCPSCLEAQSVELVPGERLCLHCRHEWEPAKTFGPIDAEGNTKLIPPMLAVVDQPQDYPPDEIDAQVAHARSVFLGAIVRCDALGVQGTITEITDAGDAIVHLCDGYEVRVGPDEFAPVDLSVIPDETIAALVTTDLVVAAQIIRAGAETITERDGARRLTLPPDGFLPGDADEMLVIEHGAAYAVALIATQHGIPTAQLVSIAEMLDTAARAAEG